MSSDDVSQSNQSPHQVNTEVQPSPVFQSNACFLNSYFLENTSSNLPTFWNLLSHCLSWNFVGFFSLHFLQSEQISCSTWLHHQLLSSCLYLPITRHHHLSTLRFNPYINSCVLDKLWQKWVSSTIILPLATSSPLNFVSYQFHISYTHRHYSSYCFTLSCQFHLCVYVQVCFVHNDFFDGHPASSLAPRQHYYRFCQTTYWFTKSVFNNSMKIGSKVLKCNLHILTHWSIGIL